MLTFKRLVKLILLVSIAFFIYSYIHKNDLPRQEEIINKMYQEPVQTETEIKQFQVQKMKFGHGEFTCYFDFRRGIDSSWYQKFSSAQGSNNHLLPKDDEVYKAIKKATTGDQIYLKGYLVDYSIKSPRGQSGTRATSTIRTDNDCEVIYTTDFQILKKGNTAYQLINQVSKYLIIICVFILIIFFFKF